MNWVSYLEPRDRGQAKRTAAGLTVLAASVTLLFAVLEPPTGGPAVLAVTYLVPTVMLALSLVMLRASEKRLLAFWAPVPLIGIVAIAGLDLATADASAAGQVFLFYPVIYAASQLKPATALVACVTAVGADAIVVLSLRPLSVALTDLCYVSVALLSMAGVLILAGRRQDALVLELRRQAAIDPLTGLVTRPVLDEAVLTALTSDSEGGTALGMLDVDRFKLVNDRHGHPVGDAALVHIAQVLASNTRSDTVISRFGGDEIAFLLPGCAAPVAMKRAEHLVQAIRENPMRLANGDLLRLSVSIGVAHAALPHNDQTLRDLYAEADVALYNAKRAGRDRVGVPANSPLGHPPLSA